MKRFYYVAVSDTARKRIVGSVTSEDEKNARDLLNKVGMAILSIGEKEPAEWGHSQVFEYQAINRIDKEIDGEMLANSEDEVLDRLSSELTFKTIKFIYSSTASEEEKKEAQKNGIRRIIQEKVKEDAIKADEEKRTFSGSLKALVNLKASDLKGSDTTAKESYKVDPKKFEGPSKEEVKDAFAQKDANSAAAKEMSENPAATAPKPEDEEETNRINLGTAASQPQFAPEDTEEEAREEVSISQQLQKIKAQIMDLLPGVPDKLAKFYYYLTKIILPPSGKTRQDGIQEMKLFLFPPKAQKDHLEIQREKTAAAMNRKATVEHFWGVLEEMSDVLAAAFISYFVLGIFSLYVEVPRVTELAEQTLRDNFTIHFLVGAFTFFRFMIFLREKFTSWSFVRTAILFTIGGVIIFFAGMNLL